MFFGGGCFYSLDVCLLFGCLLICFLWFWLLVACDLFDVFDTLLWLLVFSLCLLVLSLWFVCELLINWICVNCCMNCYFRFVIVCWLMFWLDLLLIVRSLLLAVCGGCVYYVDCCWFLGRCFVDLLGTVVLRLLADCGVWMLITCECIFSACGWFCVCCDFCLCVCGYCVCFGDYLWLEVLVVFVFWCLFTWLVGWSILLLC